MHCIIITIFHWLIYIYFLLVHFFLACLFYCLLGWYALHHHYQGSFIFHWLHMHTFSLFIFFSNFSLINCLLVFFFLAHIFLLYYPQHGWLCKHALHHHYYLSLIDCILFTFCCFLLLSYFCFFCLYSFAYLAFFWFTTPSMGDWFMHCTIITNHQSWEYFAWFYVHFCLVLHFCQGVSSVCLTFTINQA